MYRRYYLLLLFYTLSIQVRFSVAKESQGAVRGRDQNMPQGWFLERFLVENVLTCNPLAAHAGDNRFGAGLVLMDPPHDYIPRFRRKSVLDRASGQTRIYRYERAKDLRPRSGPVSRFADALLLLDGAVLAATRVLVAVVARACHDHGHVERWPVATPAVAAVHALPARLRGHPDGRGRLGHAAAAAELVFGVTHLHGPRQWNTRACGYRRFRPRYAFSAGTRLCGAVTTVTRGIYHTVAGGYAWYISLNSSHGIGTRCTARRRLK